MKLTFLGATHEVTGSCYYLEACGKKLLIDCGMEQGKDCFENQPIPVKASDIDIVLLTHAHIDHSGKIPLLTKHGFAGQIFSTEGTKLLCDIMLQDSAHIQEFEAEWKNRKNQRAGRPLIEPMYTTQDARNAMRLFIGVPYDTRKTIAEGIEIRFVDAGHLLGSASIEIWLREGDRAKKLVFSGDIGNKDQPLIKDPTYLEEADYVVMESTYGDRSHDKSADYACELAKVIQGTFDRGGNVVIPSFAVGRTQELLYFIRRIKEEGLVKGHDGFEVYVDSPLAVEATSVFMKRMYSDFDDQAEALIREGINPIGFAGLKTSVTTEDSKAINNDPGRKVILSASGMCEAGRIRHHLKHNLYRPDSTILFVGYQAEGTLGRNLIEGARQVKLFGETIQVNARICQLPGISGHADNTGLMEWIGAFRRKPEQVFVTHGEDRVTELFRDRLIREKGLQAYAPYSGTVFDLASGRFIREAGPRMLESKTEGEPERESEKEGAPLKQTGDSAPRSRGLTRGGQENARYYRLLKEEGDRLIQLIRSSEGSANGDLKQFAREIQALIERWER